MILISKWFVAFVTEWAVALTCYIICSPKLTKRQIQPIVEPKPLNRFWWNSAWLTTSGTPFHVTVLVGS